MKTICFSVAFAMLSFCGYSQLSGFEAEKKMMDNVNAGRPKHEGLIIDYKLVYNTVISDVSGIEQAVLGEFPEASDFRVENVDDKTMVFFKISGNIPYRQVDEFSRKISASAAYCRKNAYFNAN